MGANEPLKDGDVTGVTMPSDEEVAEAINTLYEAELAGSGSDVDPKTTLEKIVKARRTLERLCLSHP